MRKIAVFVEGQTELIFTRYLLMQHFESEIAFTCFRLYKKGQYQPVSYNYENPNSIFHYRLYLVGNDEGVVEELLMMENKLWNEGFEKIIALRDMYSRFYREFSASISAEINNKFIEKYQKTIQKRASKPNQIHFRFSIMEVEAWFLGMNSLFEKIEPILTTAYIQENLGYNLDEIDPERFFFNPADNVSDIFSLAGRKYNKKIGDSEAICSNISLTDIMGLLDQPKCNSYNEFLNALIGDI